MCLEAVPPIEYHLTIGEMNCLVSYRITNREIEIRSNLLRCCIHGKYIETARSWKIIYLFVRHAIPNGNVHISAVKIWRRIWLNLKIAYTYFKWNVHDQCPTLC